MSEATPKTKEKAKKRMPGWLIAIILVVAIFLAGAICCNTIGKAQANVPQSTVEAVK